MKKILSLSAIALMTIFVSCSKDDDGDTPAADFETLKTAGLTDFTDIVAVKSYQQLDNAATTLNTAITNLNTTTTEANLTAAKDAWKNMRAVWEQCEGFLFGPVEDNEYDPNMDTWPTDYVQMDSLLASTNPLTVAEVQNYTLSLRGYHPIEYIIFGNHGDRTAASITARQKTYMISLSADLKATCHALYTSWTEAPTNYATQMKTAGAGSTVFTTKQAAYLAIVDGMAAICDEVGAGKMYEPFLAMDPNIVESPYSGNSTVDFKNNIIGLQNVYLGRFGGTDGKGLNDLVAAKNIALDNKLQTQMTAAINSFDNVTMFFEEAIINQRVQVQSTMTSLATLKTTLEEELSPFVVQYITN